MKKFIIREDEVNSIILELQEAPAKYTFKTISRLFQLMPFEKSTCSCKDSSLDKPNE